MSRPLAPIKPASLDFDSEGTPRSAAYDDRYHSCEGPLAQAQFVFLGGNGLPGRWAGRERFVVLETGFGLGLNFLATWRAWRDDPARCERLHFISIEKHPFLQYDLATFYRRALPQDMTDMAQRLVERWPLAVGGLHRIEFDGGRVVLTLAFGDVQDLLPQLKLRANALYLDGFSPTCNPEMWSPQLCRQLKRLGAADVTLATWTVSAALRRALADSSFVTEKRTGLKPKRDMLAGALHPEARSAALRHRPETVAPGRVAVIGAGLAGCAMAERLAARGIEVVLIERHQTPAQEASGNAAGVLRPMVARDDSLAARFSRAAFLHASGHLRRLAGEGWPLKWGPTGVMQIAQDAAHEALQREVWASHALPEAFVRYLSDFDMARRIGYPVAQGGWWFPRGAWVNPPSLCEANLARAGEAVTRLFSSTALQVSHDGAKWRVRAADRELVSADAVVLANASDAGALLQTPLPFIRIRGQVTRLPRDLLPQLHVTVCREGYICPTPEGDFNLGASFDIGDEDTTERAESHAGNLLRLERLLPDAIPRLSLSGLRGRVAFRTSTPDRMPIIGALPGPAGLHVLAGLGARGIVWSSLGADIVAAGLCGEPLPIEHDIATAISPGRFNGAR
ncbi:MAG: bifunctional tRNA (5-methylaminomethyl-2-thiouridine)(34)-methyltransferase MnmD/FAD-dependent 5-carboxymethylaminomethyl-2-thiouridine(34) oxidoreductase MnmC [Methyloversatilis sp.]|jgi:tRNA 5-methylaminomethyl-2-thiouridine biosynthesis bifunctional protein|nr:bifunctional tRNA (5-methylaminomethyl-2-thiouridine)(34)-methyltransferase MnmD/FAD-dependent 5-carboxymethylaminomethyl-2-thiouridine(34) oxidoreductase MnmC [Methyloversatilis sp.]MBP6195555.1 bifunctional tRNA (5-methylaminomethyl-2-thiouridine)(34)-methyltransferase MnmD/FAD-dependent 5-carboxymethylaminomethyl-2-thiouridine(34) oxidoreductase MnmC [Methyloversatilis sp.]MBP9117664.1 bifunctional tRNA (5-methylaminomethyl-2-thiouridine)(34)-methyltransferase MnmD/FAD-dependent 5-carboxyme